MHHLYPSLKGDQLCPLGFHPQTRYPTRCKRCFRDYKEHGSRRGVEDVAISSPNLSDAQSSSRNTARSWTSTQNLFTSNGTGSSNDIELRKRPQSWGSTPDIDEAHDQTKGSSRSGGGVSRPVENNVDVTIKLPIPPRRHTTTLDLKEVEDSLLQSRSAAGPGSSSSTASSPKSSSSPSRNIPDELIILSTDSLAERVRKMNLLKKQRSLNSRESSRERSVPKKSEDEADNKPTPDRPERSKSNSAVAEPKRASLPPKKTSSSGTSTTTASSSSSSSSANATTTSSTRPSSMPAALTSSSAVSRSSNSYTTTSSSSLSSSSSTAAAPPITATKSSTPSTSAKSSASSSTSSSAASTARRKESDRQKATQDVEFMLKIKDTKYSTSDKRQTQQDNMSLTTETTETTLVDQGGHDRELQDEIKMLRTELGTMKTRAERAERDKSDILLRRLASMETQPNRTAASEAIMLQQKVNELKEQLEKVNEEKRKLNTRMKDIEHNPRGTEYELKRKLQATEQLCEELMEENQDSKKEIINLQAEMDELQDTFRDDDVKAKVVLQKDLEKTTKNCRILSFKLKKCERKIDTLELEKQNSGNDEMALKIKKLEEELRFSTDLTRKLQAEADELRNPGKKKTPMLGILGKSTSADAKFTRESLTRGGSQEDPQQLLRDLHDSTERESDLKDQLKFAEEEAENLRKKVARFEDENDSLMMQLKKMATRTRTRKLSPTPRRLVPESNADRDEGISDEDDPAELRLLLELNEQEASILRHKVEELEKDTSRKLKMLNDEMLQLRKSLSDKDRTIERLQSDSKTGGSSKAFTLGGGNIDAKRQLGMVEQEAAVLRTKITTLEGENEKLLKENKRMQLQALRKTPSTEKNGAANGSGNSVELAQLKESLTSIERERDELTTKLKRVLWESEAKLPARSPKRITDLTPKNHLKKWIEELEDEIVEMRVIVLNSGGDKLKLLETEKAELTEELQKSKQKLQLADGDIQRLKSLSSATPKVSDLEQKLKKSDEESKKLNGKVKELEDKIKKQDNLIKQAETAKSTTEQQSKRDKDKLSTFEKDYEKERKEREKLEAKITQLDSELSNTRKSSEKTKTTLEKEIKELKSKSSHSKSSDSKQVQDLRKQIDELQSSLNAESKRYVDLNSHWEKLSEETILMRAQLTTEKQNIQTELNAVRQKLSDLEPIRVEKTDMAKRLHESQKKIHELEAKILKSNSSDYEKTMLKNKLAEREHEFDRLRRENEMNIDLVFQLRKDNDDLSGKLNDFNRIEQAQSSINGHSASLQAEIKSMKIKLENSELQLKSEVATTRLRYEQQVKNLSNEITSMQRQCEKFKKDRDAFKQMLESAQKKIGDLKANNTGRQSRGSMHSSGDDDDKSKITYLDQQIGCLEDQLVEARLEVSKVKTELVSERSANEIKISEMQSKLNEFEEERVIGSGRTKIPGMKTKLELSWQKEREDQQRLLQETSTLARDLRQTLFEVERERDKERLESKRRLEQIKRATEEEMEEGRRKIAELQCDLLELRDVHAKLRTSNEKLRRERERYEKELIKRRMEQDGGERKVGALLQTVDELVRIAPDLKAATTNRTSASTSAGGGNTLRPEQSNARRSSRSPSPTPLSSSQITHVLARLTEASEELRKFQRMSEDENERNRLRRGNLRRAASQENDPHGSTGSIASSTGGGGGGHRNGSKLSRSSAHNGSLIRKSLSLDHSIQQDQNIWRQDDGSISSMQSIDSELGGMVRDSSYDSRLDSRLSGGSTQSDLPRGPRKKKKSLMGKLRSLTKSSRNSESEISIQGSDSDISVASDMRASKKDLRGRLSGMFKRSGSTSRSGSTERIGTIVAEQRPVAVTVVGDPDGPQPREPPPVNSLTPKPTIRSTQKPPTPTTPQTKRRLAK